MTSETILAELRQGERTTSELVAAAGASRNAVLLAMAGLNKAGYTIANVAGGELRSAAGRLFDLTGGRGGHHDARWRLVWDPEHPAVRVCSWPGCSTQLSHTNPGPYCRPHKGAVARMFLTCLDAAMGSEEVEHHEQLVLTR